MIKPVSAVKTQHVPQFGGIFNHDVPGSKAVMHNGKTVHVTGLEAELVDKYEKDDAKSSPRTSVARSFGRYLVDMMTGGHSNDTQAWDEIASGDVFDFTLQSAKA